jgi:hypothetical protein
MGLDRGLSESGGRFSRLLRLPDARGEQPLHFPLKNFAGSCSLGVFRQRSIPLRLLRAPGNFHFQTCLPA